MSALSHTQAADILRQAFQLVQGRPPTSRELLFTQAIALLETGYGRIGQFAKMADQGIFNWGALTKGRQQDGQCPAGSFPGQDTDAQGNVIDVCFFGFKSDLEAATSFVRTLTKTHWPNVIPAMNSGDSLDVATAMTQAPAYFVAPVETYAAAIASKLKVLGQALPDVVVPSLPSTSASTKKNVALVAIGGVSLVAASALVISRVFFTKKAA